MLTVGQAVLQRAKEKLGERPLASRLEISRLTLKLLIEGVKPVPDSVLLRAIDVLQEPPATPSNRQAQKKLETGAASSGRY
jgi:hypothetical protein